jgi:CheY-like chemotaxis protein
MKPRVLIFEDNNLLRSTLDNILKELGFEVFTFSDPGMCPLRASGDSICPLNHACSDIIISDVIMPTETGLEFIKERLDHGCKIKYRALMSADWSYTDLQRAQKLGCRIFHKPFNLEELTQWLNDCRKRIESTRELSDWFTAQVE